MRISDWSSDVCSSDLADDAVVLADQRARHGRAHDDAAARQALADIVIGVAEHLQGDALAQEGAERLARGAAQAHLHVIFSQARHAEPRGPLGRQAGSDGSAGVANLLRELPSLAPPRPWMCNFTLSTSQACEPQGAEGQPL